MLQIAINQHSDNWVYCRLPIRTRQNSKVQMREVSFHQIWHTSDSTHATILYMHIQLM